MTEHWCEIVRRDDATLVAKSRAVWCAIDPGTGRPRRIDARVRACIAPHRD